MRILFLNASIPCYVTDGLFHGLKSIAGISVIDIPRLDPLYADATFSDLQKTGTKGNTLYKLIEEKKTDNITRTLWHNDINSFDYIIFSDIFQQCDLFHFIYKKTDPEKRNRLIILDGHDTNEKFPFFNNAFNLKVRPWVYFYKVRKVKYFKREFENTGELYGIKKKHAILNKIFSNLLVKPANLHQISMSIPEEHIEFVPMSNKIAEFVKYNVDTDLKDLFTDTPFSELGKWSPVFANQVEYFQNIRESRFGITTRRQGWDCLRHYEYAAKGAILCFKDLDKKSEFCAPFGLNESNCIQYAKKDDLLEKIKSKTAGELEQIQENQYKWVKKHTTKEVALNFIKQLTSDKSG